MAPKDARLAAFPRPSLDPGTPQGISPGLPPQPAVPSSRSCPVRRLLPVCFVFGGSEERPSPTGYGHPPLSQVQKLPGTPASRPHLGGTLVGIPRPEFILASVACHQGRPPPRPCHAPTRGRPIFYPPPFDDCIATCDWYGSRQRPLRKLVTLRLRGKNKHYPTPRSVNHSQHE